MGKCTKCGGESGKFKRCPACLEKNRINVARYHGLELVGPKICETEGCEVEIPHRRTFCEECSRQRKLARDRKLKATVYREDRVKPYNPPPPKRKPTLSLSEQARLEAEASKRDRESHAHIVKASLGLEVKKDCPLASEVVRPPKEVWKEYEAKWKPLEQSERDFNLPLRADISYY